jgi:hypothetical protein
MAYIYQVSFDIHPDQMNELEIGGSLERVLGYLRTLLPSENGFVTARSMYSLDEAERTHLIFQSVWEHWEDLESHRESSLAEDKVLSEFQPHISLEDLTRHTFEEVA